MVEKRDIASLQALASQVADRYGIPRHLFRDYITYTSNWDPDSELEEYDFAGLGHLHPDIARMFGLVVNDKIDERFDPEKNLDATARFLLFGVESIANDPARWEATLKEVEREMGLTEIHVSLERKYH